MEGSCTTEKLFVSVSFSLQLIGTACLVFLDEDG